jgi:1,5-anhydro-D-fructose reductase (1,5-anhydro-D-mannitol-forming)
MSPPSARVADADRDPLRVLVIGAGLIGRQRARALAEIAGARLVATVDPATDNGPEEHVRHYSSLEDVSTEDYDAAVIAVPHVVAAGLATTVLSAGKPVLVEKPLGMTGEEARALETLAATVERPSFVGYNYRFLPAVARLVADARHGVLGDLRTLDLLVGHGGHPGSAEGWKLDPALAGGGVLLDPGVHLLDLLLLLAPDARCSGISATRGFWRTGIEEDVVATFQDDRLLATVRISHIRWINTFRVEVFGEDGYGIAEGRGGNYGDMSLRQGRRWAWREPGVVSQRDSEVVTGFGSVDVSLREELGAVVRAWRGDPGDGSFPYPADLTHARRVTELCDELYPRTGVRDPQRG